VRVEFPTLAASRAKDTRNDEREFFKMKDNNSGETPQVAIRFSHSDILLTLIFVEKISISTGEAQRSFPQSPDSRLNSKHLNKSQRPALQENMS